MKIIYSWNKPKELMEDALQELKENSFEIASINQAEKLGISRSLFKKEIDNFGKNPKLVGLYKEVEKLAETHDILIIYDNIYACKFLENIKNEIYIVFIATDNPYAYEIKTKPYLSWFDHVFVEAVNFDKDTTMIQKCKEDGAKIVDWWPASLHPNRYDSNLTEKDIFEKDRGIDLMHVGNPQNKTRRILDVYKAFPQFALYGRSFGYNGLLRTYKDILKRKKGWYEDLNLFDKNLIKMFLKTKALPAELEIPLYKDSKIGINIHQTYGPVNYRLYEFPANGAMQVCDCKEGLKKVFKLNKEVVGYETIKEAIELIRYYLEYDEERKKIAVAGFRRTMKDYKTIYTFRVAVEKIKQGMLEKGIEKFKDGTEIKVNKDLLKEHRI